MTTPLLRPGTRTLVGRDQDVAAVGAFVAGACQRGGALLLSGEPGIGKSALLDEVVDAAEAGGCRVLRARGVEFLSDLSFSTLRTLLQPLDPLLPLLSGAHRRALVASLLGGGVSVDTDPLLLSTAVGSLLRAARRRGPLLLVVDDLQWSDRASATVLGVIARRLVGTGVSFVGAARPGPEDFFGRAAWPVHDLLPLADDDAATLLGRQHPQLSPRDTQRVLSAAAGNPLALIELPLALGATQDAEARSATGVLPLGHRLQTAFAVRLHVLPDATRAVLLLAALDGSGELARLLDASDDEDALAALGPAESARLVHVDTHAKRVVFEHPLMRSAVITAAGPAERAAAHRALARVSPHDPVRRAKHLAAAADGPDDAVADLVERAARTVLARGDSVEAFASMLRAADLSADAETRSRRLAEAAYLAADITGGLGTAAELLVQARRADPGVRDSVRAALVASHVLLNGHSDVATAHRLLAGALHQQPSGAGTTPETDEDVLQVLLETAWYGGQPEFFRSFVEHAATSARPSSIVWLLSRLTAAPELITADDARAVDREVAALRPSMHPTRIERVATAALLLDRAAACRPALSAVARAGHSGGAGAAINAFTLLAFEAYYAGRWDETVQLAEEGSALCAHHEYELLQWPLRFAAGLVAAGRGQPQAASLAVQMDAWARERSFTGVQCYAGRLAALDGLGRGDVTGAYDAARSVLRAAAVGESTTAQRLWVALDFVEAAVATGRLDEARAHADAMTRAGIVRHAPRLELLADCCAALVADEDQADVVFQRALARPALADWPFEAARVHLLAGEWAARTGALPLARARLSEAAVRLSALGASPWSARARTALEQLGAAAGRGDSADGLTPDELQVAELAASGLSNREIGRRLYMSHRTAEAHLHRVFPKLGVTSRAALRDALSTRQPTGRGTAVERAPGADRP